MQEGNRKERGGLVWTFGVEPVQDGFGALIGGEKGSCCDGERESG